MKKYALPMVLVVIVGLLVVSGVLLLDWLFHTPIDWGTEAGAAQPRQGFYEQTGNHEEEGAPWIYLDLERRSFVATASPYHSYSVHGSFVLDDDKLIATTQSDTLVFEILNSETLLLLELDGFEGWLKEGDLYKWTELP